MFFGVPASVGTLFVFWRKMDEQMKKLLKKSDRSLKIMYVLLLVKTLILFVGWLVVVVYLLYMRTSVLNGLPVFLIWLIVTSSGALFVSFFYFTEKFILDLAFDIKVIRTYCIKAECSEELKNKKSK